MEFRIEDFYNHEYVMHKEWKDLVIFFYSRECQYDRIWDPVTRAARGIIFNKKTGELISRVFEKFFNLNEDESTRIENLPNEKFTVTDKKDGSLGILFSYEKEWYIATKGSFKSEQAQWGTKWFRENVNASAVKQDYTYLFEIIYSENRIVIHYGDFEGLVLLGCVNIKTGQEMPYSALIAEAEALGVTVTDVQTGYDDVMELREFCKALPKDKEGFVLTFENGLKVKMKGDEYCKIHKIISYMTPLAFWEAWDLETQEIPKEFLAQIPEEFRETCDELEHKIHRSHMDIAEWIWKEIDNLYEELGTKTDDKLLASIVKERYKKADFSLIMLWHNSKKPKRTAWKFWKVLHMRVRPTFNIIPEEIAGADRLKRINNG